MQPVASSSSSQSSGSRRPLRQHYSDNLTSDMPNCVYMRPNRDEELIASPLVGENADSNGRRIEDRHLYLSGERSEVGGKKTRVLIVLLSVLLSAAILGAIVILAIETPSETTRNEQLQGDYIRKKSRLLGACTTSACVTAAGNIIQTLNASMAICSDSHAFACGGWLESFSRPVDHPVYTKSFSAVEDRNRNLLQAIIDADDTEEATNLTWPGFMRKFYKRCLDEKHINELHSEPLISFLKNIEGLLPITLTVAAKDSEEKVGKRVGKENRNKTHPLTSSTGLGSVIAQLQRWGVSALFDMDIGFNNLRPESNNTFRFSQGGLGLPFTLYDDDKVLKAYERLLSRFFDLLIRGLMQGEKVEESVPTETRANASKTTAYILAKQALSMELLLRNISSLPAELRDPWRSTHASTFAELQEMLPSFDFSAYLGTFQRHGELRNQPSIQKEEIILQRLDYFRKLNAVIVDNHKNLQAYLLARVLSKSAPLLSAPYRDAIDDFKRSMSGSEPLARKRYCLDRTDGSLGWVLAKIYISRHFESKQKEEAVKILANIRESFRELFNESSWMDDSTRLAALQKEAQITPKIAFPDWLEDSNASQVRFEEFYGSLVLHNQQQSAQHDGYFNISTVMLLKSHEYMMSTFKKQRSEDDWDMTPTRVNAYYDVDRNEIVFPAAILLPPFLTTHVASLTTDSSTVLHAEKTALAALNYGALGVVIGHELTHAFDDSGAQFDGSGKLRNWWSISALTNFKKSTECLVKQYDAFKTSEGSVDAKLTLGENIADNGGVRLALRALLSELKSRSLDEQPLPGLPLSVLQVLFVSYSQLWCEKMTTETRKTKLTTDEHSLGRFRIAGVFSNLPQVQKAFGCAVNEEPCQVW